MRKKYIPISIFSLLLILLVGSLLLGQRQKRAPWEDRSPKIGKKIPDVKIYDENLNQIPLSNLYQDTYLYIQWGGCT